VEILYHTRQIQVLEVIKIQHVCVPGKRVLKAFNVRKPLSVNRQANHLIGHGIRAVRYNPESLGVHLEWNKEKECAECKCKKSVNHDDNKLVDKMKERERHAKLMPDARLCREYVIYRKTPFVEHTPPFAALLSKLPCFRAQGATFVVTNARLPHLQVAEPFFKIDNRFYLIHFRMLGNGRTKPKIFH
jgi:hypothetical protein